MIRRISNLVVLAAVAAMMTSCGAFKSYVATYSVGLKTVKVQQMQNNNLVRQKL